MGPMTSTDHPITFVAGATGKTGRRVVARLRELGRPVREGSRAGSPPFDWDEPATWDAALRGAGAAYVAFAPDISAPGAAGTLAAFAAAARDRGVTRLVLLSGRGEEEAVVSEQAVRDELPATTVVRASWFAQNFSEDVFLGPVLEGRIALPAGDVPEPFVDAGDIAAVAVAALTGDGHAGQTYELTGPRLLTFGDVAGEIAAATGRPVTYEPVTADEFVAGAVAGGVPRELAVLLADLFVRVLDGRNAHLTGDVERVLGRAPRDFADYAREAAASGAWQPVAEARR